METWCLWNFRRRQLHSISAQNHLLKNNGLRAEDIDPKAFIPAQKDKDDMLSDSFSSDAGLFDGHGRQMRGGLGGATSSSI